MFKSMRWKFITVYFLLVFIAMSIVGVFIVKNLEENEKQKVSSNLEKYVEDFRNTSTAIAKDNWSKFSKEIQQDLNRQPLGYSETIYTIYNSDVPRIVATTTGNKEVIGKSVAEYKILKSELILQALKGLKRENEYEDEEGKGIIVKHLAYPIENNMGEVKGIIYITSDLGDMYATIEYAKKILTQATILALFITVFLGFFIARSITGPINDVTVKAEKMAKGDFNQFVEVKSDDEIGQLASMFNYLTTKLKKTISEVHREKSKLDTIFTYMADGVIAVDTDGNIIHANPIALKALNIEGESINDINCYDLFKKYNGDLLLEKIKDNDNLEENNVLEIDSSVYRVKYAPYKNDKNEVGGLILVLQDVTEQQKLENMRREFVANVSHELKTPITTIKSYTETLLDGGIESKELSCQFLDVMNGECDRMARIVRDLLQLSNLDYKQTKWNKTSVDVNKLLNDIYMKMEISVKDKKQKLNLKTENDRLNITVDKDKIEQVILNVVSNAMKYTPEGGNINIKSRLEEDDVIITVKDNGIGIPKEDLDRIFERFYRVDKARSRDLGGTGLGLSIAKQIIEYHGGKIVINSKYNKGTQVDIILPIE